MINCIKSITLFLPDPSQLLLLPITCQRHFKENFKILMDANILAAIHQSLQTNKQKSLIFHKDRIF